MSAADTARAVAELIEARLAAHFGDGHPYAVRFGRIAEVEAVDRLVRMVALDLSERWIPYEGAAPAVGEVWRVLEAEDGRAWLEDWAPHGEFVFAPEPEGEVNPYHGSVRLVAGTTGSGSTPVTGTVMGDDGTPVTLARALLEIIVTDGSADLEPSATATLAAGSGGTVEAGSGTATLRLRVAADGTFGFTVNGAAGTRYVFLRQAPGSPVWVRQETEALGVVVG